MYALWQYYYLGVWHLWITSNQHMYVFVCECLSPATLLFVPSDQLFLYFCDYSWFKSSKLPMGLSVCFIHLPSSSSSSSPRSCKLKATSVPISWQGSEQCSRNYPLQNWSKQSQRGTARKSGRMKLGVCYLFELVLSPRRNWGALVTERCQQSVSQYWDFMVLFSNKYCIFCVQ